ncbi:peptidoglycan-binding domain-containing protein [Cupriavidus oxalaticus]|uniref:Peptidoglycan-binding protein n=1 Tax=Cupriavidus oxalaticus TaxID=96344 RepID=A0A4P7LP78_9BURK|nr:peptidoglycan-binding domain-containing protein [Cupriavidus oxalaticus]QBY55503.1 peptidoglycan-binding protein [Cupriavidus oxalaticus]
MFEIEEAQMVSKTVLGMLLVIGFTLVSESAFSQRCYRSQQGRCFKSALGSLDSTCTNPCGIARSPDVEAMQKTLSEKGYDTGQIDGIMGKRTRSAVMKFQKDMNLQQTGKPDKETLKELGIAKED